MVYHLDYETRSAVELSDVGAYRYAEDETTRILMYAIATESEGPFIGIVHTFHSQDAYDLYHDPRAEEMLKAAFRDESAIIYAHNAQFERAMTMYRCAKDFHIGRPLAEQWRCTAAMARRAALPASLAGVGSALGLSQQKNPLGKALISRFSIPNAEGQFCEPDHALEEFGQFAQYCLQDVRTEMEVHKALRAYELKGDVLATFQFDVRINDRGIPVNIKALTNASKIIEVCQTEGMERFTAMTGLRQTQRAKCQQWFRDRGIDLEDMKAGTIEKALARLTEGQVSSPEIEEAVPALNLYAELNYAAVKKVNTFLACANEDGKVRGTLLYHGAGTGRWSGQLVQPQNLKRPTIKNTDEAYRMICSGCDAEALDMCFGNPLEVISSCIRNFIQPHKGNILDADYAGIEARIVCWLAGQEDALERFRNKIDSYKLMASLIYGIPVEKIGNPSNERNLGKTTILGCGFQMGVDRFLDACHLQGLTFVDRKLAETAVYGFRELYDKVETLWGDCDLAARKAIASPGSIHKAGPLLSFQVAKIGGRKVLLMTLPSGRHISYPEPAIEAGDKNRSHITFYGQLPASERWGRVKTYGGSLVENATQATAADIMSHGARNAEAKGFVIFSLIHDQALAYQGRGQTAEAFCDALSELPAWANGLPIVAEGKIAPYYRKG